ncbi:MAG: DUF1552 domain-containing protein [Bryobacteraceae bacterium]|nr:DUF1552 domain-containing protein [Bryobacteraceae bacterium]
MKTTKTRLSRRAMLRGLTLSGGLIRIGLPPLEAMFNSNGTAYAAPAGARVAGKIESRFILWFNGNGIVERFWIPREEGAGYRMTPCLTPLAPFRDDFHVISGLDNPAARLPGPGNDHHRSMSALMSGTSFTGRGAGGASIDQVIAAKVGTESRFRSLEIGVCQESFGESIQRNMSWAGRDRPLPPEMIPHRLFDRLFGRKDERWIDRKKSVLDAVREDASALRPVLGSNDQARLDEYLTSVRDVERSVASLPPEYAQVVERPAEGGDLKDWPRIAKIQSDLLVHALASGQTRVASYMLTKCQGLSRFPWLGHTSERHHEYTHGAVETPTGQRVLRDICRWHVEEFAYLLAKLKATPEGAGTLLDSTCLVMAHEHAEANAHKNSGLAIVVAGGLGLKTGLHSRMTGTIGDLYLTLASEVMKAPVERLPGADRKLGGIV